MIRLRKPALLACAVLVVIFGTALSLATDSLSESGSWPWALELVKTHPLHAILILTTALAVIAGATKVLEEHPVPRRVKPPPTLDLPDSVFIERPEELEEIVAPLLSSSRLPGNTVGITTGLHGAGGFGKTFLAIKACNDPRVRQRFHGRIYVLTMGRDAKSRASIAAKVNEAVKLVGDETCNFADPLAAGQYLGRLLDAQGRCLFLIDDVWDHDQLKPFLVGAPHCVRMVTTRNPTSLPEGAVRIHVDRMTHHQAKELLTWELPEMPSDIESRLIAATGRWAILVRLVNRYIAQQVGARLPVDVAARRVLTEIIRGGPESLDELSAVGELNVDDPSQRDDAISATLRASTGLLPEGGADRFAELGIFAEDEEIPMSLVLKLWKGSGGLDPQQVTIQCVLLSNLSLIELSSNQEDPFLRIHDVIRLALRKKLGDGGLRSTNLALLRELRLGWCDYPPEAAYGTEPEFRLASDRLGAAYLWEHYVWHLVEAGLANAARRLVCDLRWVQARMFASGILGPIKDIIAVGTPEATEPYRVALLRIAHLLSPSDPRELCRSTLLSRLQDDPYWGSQARRMQGCCRLPTLVNLWPLPDTHPNVRQKLMAIDCGPVMSVTVSCDGTWIAGGSSNGAVAIWDTETSRVRHVIDSGSQEVMSVSAAPNAQRLACGDARGRVTEWDTSSGMRVQTLEGVVMNARLGEGGERDMVTGKLLNRPSARSPISVVAYSHDGSLLAGGGPDGTVQVWEASSGKLLGYHRPMPEIKERKRNSQRRAEVRDLFREETREPVVGLEFSQLDNKIVVAYASGLVRLLGARCSGSGLLTERTRLNVVFPGLSSLKCFADGQRLAVGTAFGELCLLDLRTLDVWHFSGSHSQGVSALAISPDQSLIATVSPDGILILWDVSSHTVLRRVSGQFGPLTDVGFGPQGLWLAYASCDHSVRISELRAIPPDVARHTGPVASLAIGPGCRWIATSCLSGIVRLLDSETTGTRASLVGHAAAVRAIAVSPDGRSVLTGDDESIVRVWDAETGSCSHQEDQGSGPIRGVAFGSNGAWYASVSKDGLFSIWDSQTGECLRRISERTWLSSLAVDPVGGWVAYGGHDGIVRICEVAAWTGRRLPRLRGAVRSLAASPDGTWLAAGTDDEIRIWDLATGTDRRLGEKLGPVRAICISPDGTWLAAGTDHGVRIWDLATGTDRRLGEKFGPVRAICISPDGTWLASGDVSGSVRVWGRDGNLRRTAPGWTSAVSITNDGRWLASLDAKGEFKVWDSQGGHVARIAPTRNPDIDVDAHGTLLVRLCVDGSIQVLESATGQIRFALTGSSRATGVCVGADGRWVACGNADATLQAWDAKTGRPLARITGLHGPVTCLASSPDAKWLIATAGRVLYVVDSASWQVGPMMRVELLLRGCAWSTSGAIVLKSQDNTSYLFALREPSHHPDDPAADIDELPLRKLLCSLIPEVPPAAPLA